MKSEQVTFEREEGISELVGEMRTLGLSDDEDSINGSIGNDEEDD